HSEVNTAMHVISDSMWRIILDSKTRLPPRRITLRLQRVLWEMKDRVVTAHKSSLLAITLLEDLDESGRKNRDLIDRVATISLDYIFAKGLLSLAKAFSDPLPEFETLLRRTYKNTLIRSNWIPLMRYRPGLLPGAVVKQYDEFSRSRKNTSASLEKLRKESGAKALPKSRTTHIEELTDKFRYIQAWSWGLEATLDDMFWDCLGQPRRDMGRLK
ncbi:MAG: hypothetical protein JRN38_04470, partial [Nitrososphaerota archaeon]|nr:hypothetical protein [Nitrososphaerota archaeon]